MRRIVSGRGTSRPAPTPRSARPRRTEHRAHGARPVTPSRAGPRSPRFRRRRTNHRQARKRTRRRRSSSYASRPSTSARWGTTRRTATAASTHLRQPNSQREICRLRRDAVAYADAREAPALDEKGGVRAAAGRASALPESERVGSAHGVRSTRPVAHVRPIGRAPGRRCCPRPHRAGRCSRDSPMSVRHPKAEPADRASVVGQHHRGGVELGDDGGDAAKAPAPRSRSSSMYRRWRLGGAVRAARSASRARSAPCTR
jgi:hypothetical protein